MKALSITFGVSVLACGNSGPCSQTSYGIVGQGSSFSQSNLGGQVLNSPFSSNKPWQNSASTPSNWQNSPSSVWSSQQVQTPAKTPSPRPSNPSLAGRSPSEQLQITKCRSAQSCEKCRQLNCYWDIASKITNRCVALGLESTQIPVEAGQASNLGYCPKSGQPGYIGVNWLAIENSGAAVPNIDGMSDADIQQWLSSIPNYAPDATDANYPAGDAFKELLPTAAKSYADGKIPSTTPWVAFFDSLSSISNGYSYDSGYTYDSSYTYDVPTSDYYEGGSLGVTGFVGFTGGSNVGGNTFSSGGSYPSAPAACCGRGVGNQFDQQLPSFAQPSASSYTPQLGSSFTPPVNFGSAFPSQYNGVGAFPSQPLGLGSQPLGFGSQSLGFGSQSLGFGSQSLGFASLSSQPLGFGSIPGQPLSFGQPSLSSWSGF